MTASAPCTRCGIPIRAGFVCYCHSTEDPRTDPRGVHAKPYNWQADVDSYRDEIAALKQELHDERNAWHTKQAKLEAAVEELTKQRDMLGEALLRVEAEARVLAFKVEHLTRTPDPDRNTITFEAERGGEVLEEVSSCDGK